MSQAKLSEKINQAIFTLNESEGSSVPAIVKFVQSNSKGIVAGNIKTEIKRMVDAKQLVKAKSSYKLSKEIKEALAKVAKPTTPAKAPPSPTKVAVKTAPSKKAKASSKKKAKASPKKTPVKSTPKKNKPQPLVDVPAPAPQQSSISNNPTTTPAAKPTESPTAKSKAVTPAKKKVVTPKKVKSSAKKAAKKGKKTSAKKAKGKKPALKKKAITRK